MGKSRPHVGKGLSKKMKTDFQKVKLKVGRKVPKGANVTDTAFKTRKILFTGQFKDRDIDPETYHQLSLEDLLIRVKHTNPRVCSESLKKIGDKIESDHQEMFFHLSEILVRVLDTITKDDRHVRKEAVKVLKYIFIQCDASKIESFSQLIISHLCCALTHNSITIRQDALILLDYALNYQPSNICQSEMVLKNFLDQISTRSIYKKLHKEKNSKRVLRIDPDEKVSTHEFRIEILRRLLKFIKAIVVSLTKKDVNEEVNEVIWENKSKPLYVTIYARGGLKPLMPSEPNYMSKSDNDCRHNGAVIQLFISEMMPLLFDTWKENTSVHQSSEAASSDSSNTIDSLSIVAELICAIGDWIHLVDHYSYKMEMVKWFKINYITDFCKIFMESFPYEEQLNNFQSSDVQLNFAICTLYSAFVLGTESATEAHLNAVQDYTIRSLPSQIPARTFLIPNAIKIIRNFLEYDSECVTAHCQLTCLQSILHALHPTDNSRSMVQDFFSEIALDWQYKHLLESPGLANWLASLINEIHSMVESNVIDKKLLAVIKKISTRQYPAFMEQLQNQAEDLLDLLSAEEEVVQDTAAHLITNLSEISSEFFVKLSDVIRDPLVSIKSVRHIIRRLSTRMLMGDNPNIEFPDLLGFYFSLIAGIKIRGIDQWLDHDFEKFTVTLESISAFEQPFSILPSKLWGRHSQIVEVVIECLLRFTDHENISQCTYYFLSQFLNASDVMPIHCALGLLTLERKVGCYKGYQCQENELLQFILELILCCFTYGTIVESLVESEDLKIDYGISTLHGLITNKNNAFEIVTLINRHFQELDDVSYSLAYYITRMINILLRNPHIKPFGIGAFHITLRVIKKKLGEQLESHQWWTNIYNNFCKHSRYVSSKQCIM